MPSTYPPIHPGQSEFPDMNIVILDDYQDVVRHLEAFRLLDGHAVRVLIGR